MSDQAANERESFEALLEEKRLYAPSDEFRRQANWGESSVYDVAGQDLERFWAEEAERLDWFKKWDKVLEW
ncbi:MAG: acetyl-coenzyme A synthetase N-terminal domain-containing protein, partial [Terriglobia bacterium]